MDAIVEQLTSTVGPGLGVHLAVEPTRIRTRWLGGRSRLLGASQGMIESHRRARAAASFSALTAAQLEELWSRGRLGARERCANPDVEEVLTLAAAVGVCSFAQSLEAARDFVLAEDGRRVHALACKVAGGRVPFEAIQTLTLEACDEGPTATVLRAQLTLADRPPLTFALLVARDFGTAAARLSAQASDLRVWHRLVAPRAAAIFEEGTGRVRWFGQAREVAVVAAAWIDGRGVVAQRGRLAWRDTGAPLGEPLALTVACKLAETRSALATFAPDGACERTFDPRHGHALVTDHAQVVLVGSAARSWWGALGAWPYRLASLYGAPNDRDGAKLIEGAVLAGLRLIRDRREGDALLAAMLQQAGQAELAARTLAGLVEEPARAPLATMVRELLPSAQLLLSC